MEEELVIYSEETWRILKEKRNKAIKVMRSLAPLGKPVIVHGSIARGDVREDSDIDIVVLEPVVPGLLEYYLTSRGYRIYSKEIIQATPSYIPKVYVYLDPYEEIVVSYPLAPLRPREREFYKWGGELTLKELLNNKRVPGVNKDLYLIIPVEKGHTMIPVPGNEEYTAKILMVSIDLVRERVSVLTRRRIHGRTGVFLKVELGPDEPIESVIKELANKNPFFRRALRNTL